MANCLFCRLVDGAIPSKRLHEDERCIAVHDIAPQAPVHFLILPREHVDSVADMDEAREALVGHLVHVASALARQSGLDPSGYRLVFNYGEHAGQTVRHLHLHLLGGGRLGPMC